MTGRRSGLVRAATAIALVTVCARLVGLLRVFVLTRTVGDELTVADAYLAANTVPNIVFELVAGGALAALVVPVLAAPLARDDRVSVERTVSGLLTWAVVLLTPLAALGALLREPVMRLLTDDPEKVAIGSWMLLVFMPQVVLYGIGIVLAGVLQAHHRFLGPALAPLLSSALVIGAYLLYDSYHDTGLSGREESALAVGTTLGVVLLSLSLLVPTLGLRLRLRPSLSLPPGVGAQVRRLALYAGIGVAAQQLLLGLVLRLADPVPGGVLTYNVAYTAFLLPWAVLAVPIATSAFPSLARSAAAGDEVAYADIASRALRLVVVTALLAAGALVAVAEPAARLLLGVRSGGGNPEHLASVLRAFAPGLVGYAVLALGTRAHYARDDGRSPAIAGVSGFAVAALADIAGSAVFHVDDRIVVLAAGHSIGMAVTGLLLVGSMRRAAPGATQGAVRSGGIGLAAALVGAAAGAATCAALPEGGTLGEVGRTSAAAAVAAVAFLAVAAGGGALPRSTWRSLLPGGGHG
jgi:putative peptidoglycan lipid II flippase